MSLHSHQFSLLDVSSPSLFPPPPAIIPLHQTNIPLQGGQTNYALTVPGATPSGDFFDERLKDFYFPNQPPTVSPNKPPTKEAVLKQTIRFLSAQRNHPLSPLPPPPPPPLSSRSAASASSGAEDVTPVAPRFIGSVQLETGSLSSSRASLSDSIHSHHSFV